MVVGISRAGNSGSVKERGSLQLPLFYFPRDLREKASPTQNRAGEDGAEQVSFVAESVSQLCLLFVDSLY